MKYKKREEIAILCDVGVLFRMSREILIAIHKWPKNKCLVDESSGWVGISCKQQARV